MISKIKLFNRVSELHLLVNEQSKKIEDLEKAPNADSTHTQLNSDASAKDDLLSNVAKRVEKIENNINSHVLLCRGPKVSTKIASSTVEGVANIDLIKGEICQEICGENIGEISVDSLSVNIYGGRGAHLRLSVLTLILRILFLRGPEFENLGAFMFLSS